MELPGSVAACEGFNAAMLTRAYARKHCSNLDRHKGHKGAILVAKGFQEEAYRNSSGRPRGLASKLAFPLEFSSCGEADKGLWLSRGKNGVEGA